MYYRPPDQTLGTDLETEKEIRELIKAENIIILEDFNYPHIDRVNECLSHVIYIINDCALEQQVTTPAPRI